MAAQPSVFILNRTCLEVVDHLSGWIDSLGIDLHSERSLGTMSAKDINKAVQGADALILPAHEREQFPADAHMARQESVKMMAIAANGFEWLDLEAATQHGIVVTNAPAREGVEVVADQAFALMLATARQIPHHHQLIRQGRFDRGIGVSVWAKTLGIVGLGTIGKAVARRAHGFDMQINATTTRPDEKFNRAWGVKVVPLEQLLRESDFVSLHVRLNEQTRGMIGANELAMMKKSAMLINTASQPVVDEDALTAALLSGQIAGAGLDDPPAQRDTALLDHPSFICSPHLGNRAREGMVAVLRLAIEQVVDVLNGRRPQHVLNPQVYDLPQLRANVDTNAKPGTRSP